MQLSPQEIFTIARGLEDHRDSTVFYVRATVRNARNDVLLETINLTNQGDNHRYSYPWRVPADTSGEGFYILITTSVYEDSGYTTKSPLYADKYDTYLVMQRVNPNSGHGGGDRPVDYKLIKKMINEAIASIPAPEKVDLPKIDLLPIEDALGSLRLAITSIKFPEQKSTDLSPLVKKIDAICLKAESFQISDEQLKPLQNLKAEMDALAKKTSVNLTNTLTEVGESVKKADDTIEKMKLFFLEDMERVLRGVEELKNQFEEISYVVLTKKGEKDP